MRLADLKPRWIGLENPAKGVVFHRGVSFLCPHCEHSDCPTCGAQRGKRLAVTFWPPIDPAGIVGRITEGNDWRKAHQRVRGETFDTLTLLPSIGQEPHWHGFIINGDVRPNQ